MHYLCRYRARQIPCDAWNNKKTIEIVFPVIMSVLQQTTVREGVTYDKFALLVQASSSADLSWCMNEKTKHCFSRWSFLYFSVRSVREGHELIFSWWYCHLRRCQIFLRFSHARSCCVQARNALLAVPVHFPRPQQVTARQYPNEIPQYCTRLVVFWWSSHAWRHGQSTVSSPIAWGKRLAATVFYHLFVHFCLLVKTW